MPPDLNPEPTDESALLEHLLNVSSQNGEEASAQRDRLLESTVGTTDAVKELEPLLELGLKTQVDQLKVLRETNNVLAKQGQEIQDGAQIIIKGIKGERGSQFLGYFDSEKNLPEKPVNGDFAIVGDKGTIWYAV